MQTVAINNMINGLSSTIAKNNNNIVIFRGSSSLVPSPFCRVLILIELFSVQHIIEKLGMGPVTSHAYYLENLKVPCFDRM